MEGLQFCGTGEREKIPELMASGWFTARDTTRTERLPVLHSKSYQCATEQSAKKVQPSVPPDTSSLQREYRFATKSPRKSGLGLSFGMGLPQSEVNKTPLPPDQVRRELQTP
ncbi:hypothetical protein SKAU_G00404780 [Synaphobranchus kaupii]|uniref:Uncharacterized protein n=1 Tax=Synaphobranchus kaupii TaxID=118154 RepID=A0A9Q1E9S4_SYNKA|nr:hypothetical protein SKAU_G00404780 [Synaphobranchus kaupii]